MIDDPGNFLEVKSLGEDLAWDIIKLWMESAGRDGGMDGGIDDVVGRPDDGIGTSTKGDKEDDEGAGSGTPDALTHLPPL